MKNSSILKNELIFEYAAGTSNIAKSLMASTYLFLNSSQRATYNEFEQYCGLELENSESISPQNFSAEDCINTKDIETSNQRSLDNPIHKFIKPFSELKWKNVFKGFYEYSFSVSNKEKAKLIKINPGISVPLHSHNGKEYILVLEGSFSDEYGTYKKGDLQINDSKIKHTPVANNKDCCICLSITEDDIVFFGPMAPILNLITFVKSFFRKL